MKNEMKKLPTHPSARPEVLGVQQEQAGGRQRVPGEARELLRKIPSPPQGGAEWSPEPTEILR